MPTVTLHALAPAADAGHVFRTICDFARYPALTAAVREVLVTPVQDGIVDSSWSVTFRSGVLKWSERDYIDVRRRQIEFTQTAGDFEFFTGSWTVEQDGHDCRVCFFADFDLGMPSLAAIIDPIAASTLLENIEAILRGLLRGRIVVLGPASADADVPASQTPAVA